MGTGARGTAPTTANAGRRGEGVRSDCHVRLTTATTGGVRLESSSRVEPYYGDAIRAQVTELLDRLGVTDAEVVVEDSGALPFVIAARVEAAVRRAGLGAGSDGRPADGVGTVAASERQRLRRSRLYLPGNEPKYLINGGLYRPDAVILDLEDSVHPDEKDAARLLVRNALRTIDYRGAERMIRINPLPLGLADLEAVVPEQPELILIPKVESAEQVREVEVTIEQLTSDADRPLWLMPILETALGIENSFEIAKASRRVVALTIGLEDYAADLGVAKSADGVESNYARRRMINAARAAGVQAIDSVYGQVDDSQGLADWTERAAALGFEGLGCVHPRQIPIIHRGLRPSREQLVRAREIVAAFEDAQKRGLGVVSLGSKMIDPPVVKQAQRLVERAAAGGRLGELEAEPEADLSAGDEATG